MRQAKLVGLVAVAAMAAMAMIGAGSASAATAFCKSNTSPCPGEEQLEAGSFTPNVGNVTIWFSSPFGQVNCESEIGFHTTETSGTPLHGVIDTFSLSGCENYGEPCEVEMINLDPESEIGYAATFSHSGGGNGTVSITKSELGNIGFRFLPVPQSQCTYFDGCEFTAEQVNLGFTGGKGALLQALGASFSASAATKRCIVFGKPKIVGEPGWWNSPLYLTSA